jgi:hypothetical protein
MAASFFYQALFKTCRYEWESGQWLLQLAMNQVSKLESYVCSRSHSFIHSFIQPSNHPTSQPASQPTSQPANRKTIAPYWTLLFQPFFDSQV